MSLTKASFSMIDGAVINALDYIPQAEHAAILARTSTYDAWSNIQSAIDFAFSSKAGIVYLPKGVYKISKPLYVWASASYVFAAVALVGDGVDASVIQKTGNGVLNDGSAYAAIDSVLLLSPNPPRVSGQSPTGNYNVAIRDLSVVGYSTTPNTYGIYTRDEFGQVKMERLCIQTTQTSFRTDANMWLSSFANISMHPVVNGFWMNTNGTSIFLKDTYVLGGSGIGYNLQALYSSANSIACDGFTGLPYVFKFSQWTVNGLGCESANASGPAISVSNSSNVIVNSPLILAPSGFICATGCELIVNSPQMGDGSVTARTGSLWFVAGTGKLVISDLTGVDTWATPNTGTAYALANVVYGTTGVAATQTTGTWSVVLTGSTAGSLALVTGYYTKTGKVVTCSAAVYNTSGAGFSGNLQMNLPVAPAGFAQTVTLANGKYLALDGSGALLGTVLDTPPNPVNTVATNATYANTAFSWYVTFTYQTS
jgi:hypothetical protein